MLIHIVLMIVAVAVAMLCTLLPFLPGPYDALAAPLSTMAQMFGVTGMLLVALGVVWLVAGFSTALGRRQHGFAIAALIVWSLVWALVSLAALVSGGVVLALATLGIGVYLVIRIAPKLRWLKSASAAEARAIPLYLIVVPTAVVLLQFVFVDRATEFSRGRAIENSAPLIAAIEQYRVAYGRYPPSLQAVWSDIWPSVIGVKEFRYEVSGEAYNVFFEQFSPKFGNREFVMYNPRDEHVMTSHALDLLERSPQELERRRGYFAVHAAAYPHWKYFWFD
jgi:hypothetical protein